MGIYFKFSMIFHVCLPLLYHSRIHFVGLQVDPLWLQEICYREEAPQHAYNSWGGVNRWDPEAWEFLFFFSFSTSVFFCFCTEKNISKRDKPLELYHAIACHSHIAGPPGAAQDTKREWAPYLAGYQGMGEAGSGEVVGEMWWLLSTGFQSRFPPHFTGLQRSNSHISRKIHQVSVNQVFQ